MKKQISQLNFLSFYLLLQKHKIDLFIFSLYNIAINKLGDFKMNTNLEKLEFNKILEILKKHCVTYVGKKLVDSLMPNNNKSDVKNMLKESINMD